MGFLMFSTYQATASSILASVYRLETSAAMAPMTNVPAAILTFSTTLRGVFLMAMLMSTLFSMMVLTILEAPEPTINPVSSLTAAILFIGGPFVGVSL